METTNVRVRRFRLAYLVSHPIQYQAPLLRRIAQEPDIDLTVYFGSNHSVAGYSDQGFGGVQVKWDVPLLDGYRSEFLPVVLPMSSASFFRPANTGIFRALRKGKFDALWLHGYWNINSIIAMLAARLLGIPVLLRSDSTLSDRRRPTYKLLIKKLFFSALKPFVSAVLPTGTWNRQYWEHYFGPKFPSFTLPYAVDNEFFQRMSREASLDREAFRKQLGLKEGRPVILYASKLMERKRCIDLVEAYLGMRRLPDGELPYLLILGDGEQRTIIEARLRNVKSSEVQLLGFQNQSQLPRFFDLCDIFVLPSVDEPFALIVNEVMNASKPVVVSDEVGCHTDLVRNGGNGMVFPARNVEALRNVLDSLISNPQKCAQMGKASLTLIDKWSFEEDVRGMKQALKFVGCPKRTLADESLYLAPD